MQQLMSNFRTMFLFRGLAAILFGILTLVWPKMSLTALVFLFGVFAVVSGITAVAATQRNRGERGWELLLLEGILGILAGVVALVWPSITALAFLYLLAAWAILTGTSSSLAQSSSDCLEGASLHLLPAFSSRSLWLAGTGGKMRIPNSSRQKNCPLNNQRSCQNNRYYLSDWR